MDNKYLNIYFLSSSHSFSIKKIRDGFIKRKLVIQRFTVTKKDLNLHQIIKRNSYGSLESQMLSLSRVNEVTFEDACLNYQQINQRYRVKLPESKTTRCNIQPVKVT